MSTPKTKKLGRGFATLIPDDFDKSLIFDDREKVEKIGIENLMSNPEQPRTTFDEDAINELANSIKQYGLLQPLVVSPDRDDKYIIIAGERRWRAAQIAGLKKIPALVRTAKEMERLEMAIVENVQRVDLSPLEQAVSVERLHQQFNMTYEAIAKRLGKASSTVNNIVRLLQLPEPAREALRKNKITEGHARAILALKDFPDKQADLLTSIINQGWSVRQAERYVTSVKEGYKDTDSTKARMSTETPATKQLSQRLGGAAVHIRRLAKGGKLEIGFKTDEELQKILETISG